MRDRAALARARGDETLAKSLEDVARRNSRQAYRLRKEAKASGETKSSARGEAFSKLAAKARRNAAKAAKAGNYALAKQYRADAEMHAKLAVQNFQADGVRNRRVKEAEGKLSAESVAADARKLAAEARRKARSAESRGRRMEEAAARDLRARKRAIGAARRAAKERYDARRKIHVTTGHSLVRGQQMVTRVQARITREMRARDKKIEEDIRKKAADKAAVASAKSAAAKKVRDEAYAKTKIGQIHNRVRGAAGRVLDKITPHRKAKRQENEDEAKAKLDSVEARKSAGKLRKDLKTKRAALAEARAVYDTAKTPSERALARAAMVEKATAVKNAREAVSANAAKGKAAKETLARVAASRQARVMGSLSYKLGAPARAVKRMGASASKKFQTALSAFKEKHGIDKPLLPWQRRSLMQKLFANDKGYKGKTYIAGGAGGIGGAAILGRRGQQITHPDDVGSTEKMPYALHKGKKGGVFYYGPNGHKHYISHGGVFGFIKSFKAGSGGHQLLR